MAMSTRMRNANNGSCSSGPLGAEDDAGSQNLVPDAARAAMQMEQRFVRAHEVAHLRHKLDHATRAFGHGNKFLQIDRENDRRGALVEDRARHRAGILLRRRAILRLS